MRSAARAASPSGRRGAGLSAGVKLLALGAAAVAAYYALRYLWPRLRGRTVRERMTAVVVGGTRGLGLEIARVLCQCVQACAFR